MSIDLVFGVSVFYVIVGITMLIHDFFICGGFSDVIEEQKEKFPWMDEKVLTVSFYVGVILGTIFWPVSIMMYLVEEE